MSYLIPTQELALQGQANLRRGAELAGAATLVKKSIIARAQETMQDGRKLDNFVARDAFYPVDFVPVATRAGLAGWLTMPLLVVGTAYSVFADNVPAALTPQVPNNAVWVFYGVTIIDTTQAVSELLFLTGNSQNRVAQFDLEKLYSKLETDGYFSQPVVYDPQEICGAQVVCRVISPAFAIELKTLIVEPNQVTLSPV